MKDQPAGGSPAISNWKLIVIAMLAVGVGFLAFNFHHILRVSHVHISLAQHHRTHAFCTFTGCTGNLAGVHGVELTAEVKAAVEDAAVNSADVPADQTQQDAAQPLPQVVIAPPRNKSQKLNVAIPKELIAEVTAILASRVCGQPAIDGYMHVVPKCLEDSPTNKWWQAYYAAGGRQEDLVMHIEKAAGYDGLAVGWGINNKVKTAEECGRQCLNHMPNPKGSGPYDKLPCNVFVWCPDDVCFEPDAHHHTKGDCWLKFTEGPVYPELNQRGVFPDSYKKRHPNAPNVTQWWSGVLLPAGIEPTNGTWSVRWEW